MESKTKWRRYVRIIHRDIGYLAAGLTIIYAVSGVAVNHIGDWNPNYIVEKSTTALTIDNAAELDRQLLIKAVLSDIGEEGKLKTSVRPDPNSLRIFVEGNTIDVDLEKKLITQEKVTSRPIIRETNFLHLNIPKGVWTYVADLFAAALAFLAISGLFMIRGKNGIKGRGAWLTAIGVVIPLIFWLLLFSP